MIKRKLEKSLREHLDKKEMTFLIGPRQAGKTTLLKHLESELKNQKKHTLFLNLDIDTDAQFFTSQEALVSQIKLQFGTSPGYVFIDEIQRKTNAGVFLKGIYDRDLPYKFIISGSGSVELKEHIHESLTGRKRIFTLNTVSFEEFVDYKTDYAFSGKIDQYLAQNELRNQHLLKEYLLYGGYPRVVTEPRAEEKKLVLQDIYQSYLARDISLLLGIKKPIEFTDLVKVLADQVGKMTTFAKLASGLNISFLTLQNYLWALEQTFVVERVTPYSTNLLKELKKAPQFYFLDLGLRNALLDSFQPVKGGNERGFVFQNFIFRMIRDTVDSGVTHLHYWRTKQGSEVDFILEKDGEIIPIEVKSGNLTKNTITYGMSDFLREYQPKKAYVVNLFHKEKVREGKTDVYFIPYYELFSILSS